MGLDTYEGKRPNVRARMAILVGLMILVGVLLYTKQERPQQTTEPANAASLDAAAADNAEASLAAPAPDSTPSASIGAALPKMVDLGADKCVPCKMMAPVLEDLKKTYAGKLDVVFIDVWKNPGEADKYGVNVIPTQIFYDALGKERFRHEGFFAKEDILAKWKELGVDLGAAPVDAPAPAFSRLEPAVPDSRAKDRVCYLCDGDINPATRAVLKTDKGDVAFCSPHCFFITYSSIPGNKPAIEMVSVTDWGSGALIPAAEATMVYGVDAANRPTIKAFGASETAASEQQKSGGNLLNWSALQEKELATTCGFCDRAVYPDDACAVKVDGGMSTWGCCPMCALGVAARLQKDIEVSAKDSLSGEVIKVKTAGGHVALLDPASAIAWAGTKKDPEGKLVSTGCFKQAFFTNEENLKKWVETHPAATGRMITIEQALAEKMKLTPQQISKACKIGECSPK